MNLKSGSLRVFLCWKFKQTNPMQTKLSLVAVADSWRPAVSKAQTTTDTCYVCGEPICLGDIAVNYQRTANGGYTVAHNSCERQAAEREYCQQPAFILRTSEAKGAK